jgi:hypothetical protein
MILSASRLVPFLYAMSCRMQISSILLIGFDHCFGVPFGFKRRFSLVLGPQKLYFLKLRVLK